MNPVQQIGRYMLPLFNVVAIQKRNTSGWRKFLFWRQPGYDVLLNNGHTIHFTEEEKQQYDEAMEWHSITLGWYGMAKGMGLRG